MSGLDFRQKCAVHDGQSLLDSHQIYHSDTVTLYTLTVLFNHVAFVKAEKQHSEYR